MRRISRRRRAEYDEVRDLRESFKYERAGSCCICDRAWVHKFPARIDVHEMLGGGMRCVTHKDRRAWLLVCATHHELLQDRGKVPYVDQFALKLLTDPEHFDLPWLLSVGGWADTYITQRDVELAAKERRWMQCLCTQS